MPCCRSMNSPRVILGWGRGGLSAARRPASLTAQLCTSLAAVIGTHTQSHALDTSPCPCYVSRQHLRRIDMPCAVAGVHMRSDKQRTGRPRLTAARRCKRQSSACWLSSRLQPRCCWMSRPRAPQVRWACLLTVPPHVAGVHHRATMGLLCSPGHNIQLNKDWLDMLFGTIAVPCHYLESCTETTKHGAGRARPWPLTQGLSLRLPARSGGQPAADRQVGVAAAPADYVRAAGVVPLHRRPGLEVEGSPAHPGEAAASSCPSVVFDALNSFLLRLQPLRDRSHSFYIGRPHHCCPMLQVQSL